MTCFSACKSVPAQVACLSIILELFCHNMLVRVYYNFILMLHLAAAINLCSFSVLHNVHSSPLIQNTGYPRSTQLYGHQAGFFSSENFAFFEYQEIFGDLNKQPNGRVYVLCVLGLISSNKNRRVGSLLANDST